MKHTNIIFLFGLFPLVATSSHIAYAIVMIASLWIFFGSYLLGSILASFLKIEHEKLFIFFFTFCLFCVYVRLGEVLFPVIYFALLPYLYILGFSYIIYFCLEEYENKHFPMMLIQYSMLFFLISFIRELLAFGSVSLPSIYGIASFNIFELLGLSAPFKFLGSTAGTMMMVGFAAAFYFWYNNDDILYVRKKD